jgi:tRNA threonylcarbamoyl adenosine modification protein YeaZ
MKFAGDETGPLTVTLNASETRVQFLLSRGTDLLCAQDWLARNGGTELLMPALASACGLLGVPVSDIRRVACVTGPGGFTGIRLAVTTAVGLARAGQARQAGLNYLQCLAASVPAEPGACLHVLTHARRGLAYVGRYRVDGGGLPRPLEKVGLCPLPHADGLSPVPPTEPASVPDYVLGSALTSHREWFAALYPRSFLLPAAWDHPTPAGLLALARDVDWDLPEHSPRSDPAPFYLRDCDAVENLDAIARAQGRDPEAARAELARLTREKPSSCP